MKKHLKKFLTKISFTISILATLSFVAVTPAAAIDVLSNSCGGGASVAGQGSGGKSICGAKGDDLTSIMHNVVNTLLIVLGMIAVIMIVIGGIRYTTSNGDASQIKGAKDTILYAVIGLIVAIMSYAIVQFVLASVKK
jgi:hypothetical protein